jgi:hypothetical protein
MHLVLTRVALVAPDLTLLSLDHQYLTPAVAVDIRDQVPQHREVTVAAALAEIVACPIL